MASAGQFFRAAAEAHPAFLKTIGPVRDRHGVDEILLDQNHACAPLFNVSERRIDVADDDRSETETEFVAEKNARVRHQASSDGDHLLLAAGQRRRRRVATLPQHGKELVDAVEIPRPAGTPAVGADQQVFLNRQRSEQTPSFRHQRYAEPDDIVCRKRPDIVAVKTHGGSRARQQARNRFQEGGLPGPVGADDGDCFTLVESERNAEQRLEVAVKGGELEGLQHGLCQRLKPVCLGVGRLTPRCPCRSRGPRSRP